MVRSLEGEELARVDTRWTLVDTDAGKIIRHIPEEMDRYWSDTIDWELSLQVPKAAQLTTPASGRRPTPSATQTATSTTRRTWTWSATPCRRT